MRTRAVALVAVALVSLAGALAFVRWSRAPAAPLSCREVVGIETDDGLRLACVDDPALAKCPEIRPGARYRGCAETGVVPGALLLLRGLKLDANRASAEDFASLPDVGPKLAKRIVEAREARPLCSPGDLAAVPGLGAKRVAELAGHLSFDHPLCRSARAQ